MRSDGFKSAIAVAGAFVLVLAMGTLGWALLRSGPTSATASATWREAGATASGSPTATPPPDVIPTTPATTPAPTPTKKTSTKKPTPKVTKTEAAPPAPPPPVKEEASCQQHLPGQDASASEVSAALATAGARQYWAKPDLYTPSPVIPVPKITVPLNLMKAFAFMESSWRSTIISCDHGVGLMQVMAGTGEWMNGRFDTNYDMNTLSGNTALGAEYIEWLIMHFGAVYFGTFDLNATAPVGDGGATMRLLDVVISGYNNGSGVLDNLHDTPDDLSDDTIHPITNTTYVSRVIGYMTNCPCDAL
jgi:hypothetical protein